METQETLFQIVDSAIKDISRRVAKLDMVNTDSVQIKSEDTCTLYTTTRGDYCLTIILYTKIPVLKAITENMKRSPMVSEDDFAIYPIEYFNVLCGHVITAMNKAYCTKARFDVPQIIKGLYSDPNRDIRKEKWEYCYNSSFGPIKLEIFYQYV